MSWSIVPCAIPLLTLESSGKRMKRIDNKSIMIIVIYIVYHKIILNCFRISFFLNLNRFIVAEASSTEEWLPSWIFFDKFLKAKFFKEINFPFFYLKSLYSEISMIYFDPFQVFKPQTSRSFHTVWPMMILLYKIFLALSITTWAVGAFLIWA